MEAERQELLEQAARAYMDADYDAAVALWQQVLESEPDNLRAREGLKKVEMLRVSEALDEGGPSSPLLQEIEALLDTRRFEEALEMCRQRAGDASPAVAAELRRLQQQAERARVAEPEIQRAVHSARTALKEGRVKDAVPYLKEVLALDKEHPIATRLMKAIRDRVQSKKSVVPPPPRVIAADASPDTHAAAELAAEPIGDQAGPLPASGQPGSDAPDLDLDVPDEPPAPPGMGLPSSPPAMEGDDLPELELETIDLEDEGPALEPVLSGAGGPQTAQVESPFTVDDEKGDEPSQRAAAGTGSKGSDEDAEIMPALTERPGVASPEMGDAAAAPVRASRRGGRSLRSLMLIAAVVTAAGLGAAWWFGVVEIPGLPSTPEPRSLVVPRPAPKPDAGGRPADAEHGETGPASPAAGQPAATGGNAVPDPSPATDPAAALKLFEDGQDHFEAGRTDEAVSVLERALRLDPMNGEISSLLQKALARQESVQGHSRDRRAAVKAFEDKDFDDALRRFYRLREDQAEGPWDTYISSSWFNWGLQLLANGNLREAENKMDEALSVNPDDQEALEIKNLISTYASRPKDRVFFLRVEALRYRPLEG